MIRSNICDVPSGWRDSRQAERGSRSEQSIVVGNHGCQIISWARGSRRMYRVPRSEIRRIQVCGTVEEGVVEADEMDAGDGLRASGIKRGKPAARLPLLNPTYWGLTSTNPAALKSPSKANASRIRRRRITAKLVASTKEYSRSARARSQRQASVSLVSST